MHRAQYAPTTQLFELLEFCGIRQRDVVEKLGVSKSSVSLWRSGQRNITPEHYTALLDAAKAVNHTRLEALLQITQAPTTTPAAKDAAIADAQRAFALFAEKLQAAQLEHDPTTVYGDIRYDIAQLNDFLSSRGLPVTWNDETLGYLERETQRLCTLVRRARARIAAQNTQETSYATLHTNGESTTECVGDSRDIRSIATLQPDEESLRNVHR